MTEKDSPQPPNLNPDEAALNESNDVNTSASKEESKIEEEEKAELNENKLEGENKLEEEEKAELKEKIDLEEKKVELDEKVENQSELFAKTQPECPVYQNNESKEKEENDTPESLAKRLLKGEDISILQTSDTIPVIEYLSSYRDEHLRNHDVKEGEHAENIICQIQDGRKNSIKSSIAEEKAKELQKRIDEANQQLTELEERVQNTMKSLKTENQNNLDKLRQNHEKEMNSFTSKWQSSRYTKRFTRASTALRSLRVQSILLMNQKRFDELRKTDKIASKLEKEETEEMSRAMNNEYDKQLKMLIEKQQNEINVLKSTQQRRVASLKTAGDEAIETIQKRINHLQYNLAIAKDPNKYWNVYHRNESAVLSRAIKTSNKQDKLGRSLNMKTINSLKLPPLVDPRAKKVNKGKSQTVSPSK